MKDTVSASKAKKARRGRTRPDFAAVHPIPLNMRLDAIREEAKGCRACELYKHATQTVFGEGAVGATIMLVGEQPGDQEDREGHPFVGSAGRVLNEALAQAGIDRDEIYVTNVVKHFKWVAAQRGKRRIHKKPRFSEIHACRPWLDAELELVKPQVLVCLGATAAQAIFGRQFSVMRQHGQLVQTNIAPFAMATIHPSAMLRAPDDDARHAQMRMFVEDLRRAAARVREKRAA